MKFLENMRFRNSTFLKFTMLISLLLINSINFAQEEGAEDKEPPRKVKSANMSQNKRTGNGKQELTGNGKSGSKYNKRKEARKQAREQRKRDRQYKKLRKKQQNNKTTKRMKKNERKANRQNNKKKGTLVQRMFGKKK